MIWGHGGLIWNDTNTHIHCLTDTHIGHECGHSTGIVKCTQGCEAQLKQEDMHHPLPGPVKDNKKCVCEQQLSQLRLLNMFNNAQMSVI